MIIGQTHCVVGHLSSVHDNFAFLDSLNEHKALLSGGHAWIVHIATEETFEKNEENKGLKRKVDSKDTELTVRVASCAGCSQTGDWSEYQPSRQRDQDGRGSSMACECSE